MAIESNCEGCGQRLRVGEEFVGRQARCPACGRIYVVGQPAAFPSPLANPTAPNTSEAPSSPVASPEEASFTSPSNGGASVSVPQDSPKTLQYFAKTPDGTVYGPTDLATIQRWQSEGRLNASCQFRESDSAFWKSLSELGQSERSPGSSRPVPGSSRPYSETVAYGDPKSANPGSVNPYSQPLGGSMQNTRTDQSTTILMLGIFSWVLSCCSIGWVLAIVGTILGYQELKGIREGRIPATNQGNVQIGFWLCVVHLILSVLGIIAYIAVVLVSLIAA